MKENKKKEGKGGKLLCKLAEWVAPQASEFCVGFYYQPKEPDNLNEFVTKSLSI